MATGHYRVKVNNCSDKVLPQAPNEVVYSASVVCCRLRAAAVPLPMEQAASVWLTFHGGIFDRGPMPVIML